MRRLLITHRWELWLLLGVPAVALIAAYAYRWSPLLDESYSGGFFVWHSIRNAVAALMLGAAYSRVRRLGRPLLFLVWRYSLTVAVVSAVGYLAAGLLYDGLLSDGGSASRLGLFFTAVGLAGLFVLLWFARQASRISLAHAFLLIALAVGTSFPSVRSLDLLDSPFGVAILSAEAIGLASILLAVWALAHFDGLDRRMRTCSIVALFALSGLRFAALVGIGIAPLIAQGDYMEAARSMSIFFVAILPSALMLGLTYLVRVRPADARSGIDLRIQ